MTFLSGTPAFAFTKYSKYYKTKKRFTRSAPKLPYSTTFVLGICLSWFPCWYRLFGDHPQSQLPLSAFLETVGKLKFRGTSILFRMQEKPWIQRMKRLRDSPEWVKNTILITFITNFDVLGSVNFYFRSWRKLRSVLVLFCFLTVSYKLSCFTWPIWEHEFSR